MPLYKDETLKGAISKAIGDKTSVLKTSNPCSRFSVQFSAKRLELQTLIEADQRLSARLGPLFEQYHRYGDEAERDRIRADGAALIDAFALGPGTIHSIMRVTDPGSLEPREVHTWYTRLMAFLENVVFPDRRARYSSDLESQATGAVNEVLRQLRDSLVRIENAKRELEGIAGSLRACTQAQLDATGTTRPSPHFPPLS